MFKFLKNLLKNSAKQNVNSSVESNPQPLTINDLSADILLTIMNYLPPQDLKNIAQVSKTWQAISNENVLWKKFVKPENRDIFFNNQKANYKFQENMEQSVKLIEENSKKLSKLEDSASINFLNIDTNFPVNKLNLADVNSSQANYFPKFDAVKSPLGKEFEKLFSQINNYPKFSLTKCKEDVIYGKWKDDDNDHHDTPSIR